MRARARMLKERVRSVPARRGAGFLGGERVTGGSSSSETSLELAMGAGIGIDNAVSAMGESGVMGARGLEVFAMRVV